MRILVSGRLPDGVLHQLEAVHEVTINPHDAPMARTDLLDQVAD